MRTKLPGLNGLRAIAASFVLVSHVYQIAGICGDAASANLFYKHSLLGTDMVNLFFVISGFIITYILFKEKKETGTISLKRFYIKRFLRIWPLYFGIILVVLLLNRFANVYPNFREINLMGFFLLSTFLVTLGSVFPDPSVSVLPHYWSLSVEEQFYIFWPPIFKRLKGSGVFIFSVIVVVGMVISRNVFAYLSSHHPSEYITSIAFILDHSLFGSIAIGIIGAWLLINKHAVLKIIFNPVLQVFCWIVLLSSILFSFFVPYIHYEVMACIYLVLILNVTSNSRPVISLENKPMDKTGTISYGIYMYHWPLIPVIIWGVKKIGAWDFFVATKQIPLLLISYGLVWLLAAVSYKYVESFFLKLRPGRKPTPITRQA